MILDMLFAPKDLYYLAFKDNKPFRLTSKTGKVSENQTIIKELSTLDGSQKWFDTDNGFLLSINNKGNVLGAIKIDNLAFPEYKQHYLNLSSFLVEVCILAIRNVQSQSSFDFRKV